MDAPHTDGLARIEATWLVRPATVLLRWWHGGPTVVLRCGSRNSLVLQHLQGRYVCELPRCCYGGGMEGLRCRSHVDCVTYWYCSTYNVNLTAFRHRSRPRKIMVYDVMNRSDRREAFFGDGQPRVSGPVSATGERNRQVQSEAQETLPLYSTADEPARGSESPLACPSV